ncbi:cation/H(+) antiporter 28-like [Aristolochia californica]|uniref:cation/H(+) antiporter 28-like n=1 Tax=Aristolochia californica TaxID=171875 RepID=UPI0035D9F807
MGMKSFWDLIFLVSIGMIGKVLGTVAGALYLGFGFPDAICLGLLLNVMGHYHLLGATNAIEVGVLDRTGFLLNVLCVLTTIVYIPWVSVLIVKQQRSKYGKQKLTLQLINPELRLRMIVCAQDPHHVPSMIKIIEATKGEPTWEGLVVHAMDLVELTERAAATLTYGLGTEAVEVSDETIVEMRQQITAAFDAYLAENGDRISLRRLLVISNYSNMHQDVCNAAQDAVSTLIIMPFHKKQRVDGTLDYGNAELRNVNKKVLLNAPCSVGILVDRGLSGTTSISTSLSETFNVGVVFIGGADDREALCYVGRIGGCPNVMLTVIRFLVDSWVEAATATTVVTRRYNRYFKIARRRNPSTSGNYLLNTSRNMEEIRLDNECFFDFCERNIENGRVSFVEKYVSSGSQTIATLRDFQEENSFNLYIVGLAGRGSSMLRAEMSNWQECPELGPLGDNLTASDFSFGASVLIIQQHNPQRQAEENLIQDDF